MRNSGVPTANIGTASMWLGEQERPHRGAPRSPSQEEATPAAAPASGRRSRQRDRRDRVAAVFRRQGLLPARFGELPRFGAGVLQLVHRIDGVRRQAVQGWGDQHRGGHRQAQDDAERIGRRLNVTSQFTRKAARFWRSRVHTCSEWKFCCEANSVRLNLKKYQCWIAWFKRFLLYKRCKLKQLFSIMSSLIVWKWIFWQSDL